MKALIIGGSGSLSGFLAQKAMKQYEVWAVTRGQRRLPEGICGIVADRNEERAFRDAVFRQQTQWDVVFDCICMNEYHARQDLEVISRVTKRLVVISTDSVYDPRYKEVLQTEDGIFVEETGAPETCTYAGNKRKMERVFEDYFAACGKRERESRKERGCDHMQVTLFRPGHIYGPGFLTGCFPEQSRQEGLPEQILRGEALRLVAEGIYLTQPIFVGDLADAMLDCVDKPASFQEIFCIGGPDIMENRRYYEIMGELLGTRVVIEEIPLHGYFDSHPEFQGHLCHRAYNLAKLKKAGVKVPAVSFKEGMRAHLESLGYL